MPGWWLASGDQHRLTGSGSDALYKWPRLLYFLLYLLVCFRVAGRAAEVVKFVTHLECQVLHTVLQLFDSQLDAFTADSAQFSLSLSNILSSNKTDEQKTPEMLLTTTELMDRFKEIIMTCVNFVLFSSQ